MGIFFRFHLVKRSKLDSRSIYFGSKVEASLHRAPDMWFENILCFSSYCGFLKLGKRNHLKPADRSREKRMPVISLLSTFLLCSELYESSEMINTVIKSNNYCVGGDESPDECRDNWAVNTRELGSSDQRVWRVCFAAHVFNQPASNQPTPPFTTPQRPMVMPLRSVWNSWKDETREEKNGGAEEAWNKLASRRDRDQRAICSPLCELQAGASRCL